MTDPNLSDPLVRHEIRDRLRHAIEFIDDDIRGHVANTAGGTIRERNALLDPLNQAIGSLWAAQNALEAIEHRHAAADDPRPYDAGVDL